MGLEPNVKKIKVIENNNQHWEIMLVLISEATGGFWFFGAIINNNGWRCQQGCSGPAVLWGKVWKKDLHKTCPEEQCSELSIFLMAVRDGW